MISKEIKFFGKQQITACDGQCHKAWGMNRRPKHQIKRLHGEDNPDDYAYLADHELGFAPADPGTYEGLNMEGKPCNTVATDPAIMNRWCVRECERNEMVDVGAPIVLPDFNQRVYNIPSSRPKE